MKRPNLPGDWGACLDAFLQSLVDRSGSTKTRDVYCVVLETFFRSGLHPERVTRADVQAFLAAPSFHHAHKGRMIGPAAKNSRKNALHSFYSFASLYEVNGQPLYQKANPAAGFPHLKEVHRYKSMSAEELERLFAVIPDDPKGIRDKAAFLFAFWTGRRREEIVRMRWGDIEPATIAAPDGRRHEGYVYHFTSKGKSRERQTAELPEPAYRAIVRYLEASGRMKRITKDAPLFAVSGSSLNDRFKEYCRKAGLSQELTLHSLRHTGARLRFEAGSDLVELKQWLGHSSLATTDMYLRWVAGHADTGARRLYERFGKL